MLGMIRSVAQSMDIPPTVPSSPRNLRLLNAMGRAWVIDVGKVLF
jgi:hypothetical protein